MNKAIIFSMLLAVASPVVMADNDYDDDIYYNPKKSEKTSKKSNYIKNYDQIDVDTYNRRGQYYVTPIDTIGDGVGLGEDFVYTQQIQKYINPTIVIDNADLLADVLENAYGNVDIVINDGVPTFAPVYTYPLYPRYYYNWGPSWTWSWGWGGPGWGVSIGYDPWYPGWGWGWNSWWSPSWAWGGPGWGWGPAWGGPGWRPRPNHNFYAHNWRPNGRSVNNPGNNWAGNSRPSSPGFNYQGAHRGTAGNVAGRPSSSGASNGGYTGTSAGGHRTTSSMTANPRPGYSAGAQVNGTRPNGSSVGSGNSGSHRPSGGRVTTGSSSATNRSTVGGTTTSNPSKAGGYNYNSGSNRSSGSSYNSGSSRGNSSTRSSGSFNSGSHRSSGGSVGGGGRSSGGGRSGGGGGGGRHR